MKLCAFLGKDLTDEAIDHVVEASTFKNMKTNPKANYKDLIEKDRYKTETMRKGLSSHTNVSTSFFTFGFQARVFPFSASYDLSFCVSMYSVCACVPLAGIAGDWKNLFTVSQNEHFDQVFKERMGDVPLSFIWEIKQ